MTNTSGIRSVLVICLCLTVVASAAKGEWQISQNNPDPFCNDPASPEYESTFFTITGGPTAHVTLEVWNPDTTVTVGTWDLGELESGYVHRILWFGKDSDDALLPEDDYPYRIAVGDALVRPVTYSDWRVAHITCDTPVDEGTWGRIKGMYRCATSN